MKLIREYKEYTLMDKISDKLSGIFPNVKIVNNILLALFAFIFYKLEFDNLKKLKNLE